MNIIFTGGGSPKGAYIVAKLEEAGHKVFTIGRGDRDCPADFSRLSDGVLGRATRDMLRKFEGLPEVIIHNARTTGGNVNHALYCNINARIRLDLWALEMLRGKDNHFRSIHILGWSPKWALTSYPALVSYSAQLSIPTAFVKHREPLVEANREEMVLRDRAFAKFEAAEAAREKEWDAQEARTAAEHKKRELDYEKRPFEAKKFVEPEVTWAPNISAVMIAPDRDLMGRNEYTRERMAGVVFKALDWEHTDEERFSWLTP